MAIVDWEEFTDKDVARVYLAGRLREAKAVENTLSGNGIDYAVDIEPFKTYLFGILPRKHKGVAFYVLKLRAEHSRQVLQDAGLMKGLILED